MKFIKLLAVLGSTVLFADACGKCTDCDIPPILYDDCICGCGTVLFRLSTGVYKTQSVGNVSEDCGLGLTPELLISDRQIQNDASTGEIRILSADGTVTLGKGPVRCNKATLTDSATHQTETCIFDTARSSQLELTADTTFTLKYTETRTKFRSVPGMTCVPPASGSCAIAYTLNLKK